MLIWKWIVSLNSRLIQIIHLHYHLDSTYLLYTFISLSDHLMNNSLIHTILRTCNVWYHAETSMDLSSITIFEQMHYESVHSLCYFQSYFEQCILILVGNTFWTASMLEQIHIQCILGEFSDLAIVIWMPTVISEWMNANEYGFSMLYIVLFLFSIFTSKCFQ